MSHDKLLDLDSFASGQVLSKIWLIEELEKIIFGGPPIKIAALGGWYGLLNFIMRTRNNINVHEFTNIDIDQNACEISEKINKSWAIWDPAYKTECQDANYVDLSYYDVIINTSVEHFKEHLWFDNLAEGTLVAVQSNNMIHADHYHNHKSSDELMISFPFQQVCYVGDKIFDYGSWKFTRYMVIGYK